MSADVPPDGAVRPGDSPAEQPDFGRLLGDLDDLSERPVAEHHDRLAEVHEALHAALHQPPAGAAGGPPS